MVRQSAKRRKVFHWIPPNSTAAFKLTVTRTDGTVDDISSKIHMYEIEDGKTEVIGRFEFELWNPNETYTDVWNKMDLVKYYSDYAATATTIRFKGYIEKISYRANKIKVTGRSTSLKLQEQTVTKQYSSTEASVILKDLLDSYGTAYTQTNINVSTTILTKNWYEKPFWECVTELCNDAGFDAYLDASDDFHFIESGSVINTGEAIVHTYNLIEVGDFAEDSTFVKNKVRVYGANVDGIQILKTADDTASQSTYGVRADVVNNDNITDETQAQEHADNLLALKKDPPVVGEVIGLLLASIQPAEYIYLSSPLDNIPPNSYSILSYKHRYNANRGLTTTVNVNKEPKKFIHIMKSMASNTTQLQATSVNPFQMDHSVNLFFDIDSGTHSTTEITDGVLKPTAATGTWISDNLPLDFNLGSVYLVMIGETLTGATVSVSGNNGNNWDTVLNKDATATTITNSKGPNIKVRVVFSSADTQINTLQVQYKQ